MEAKLSQVTDDLASMMQALRLMSTTQRQHSEMLRQLIVLLTPEQPVRPGPDLGTLLTQLVGWVTQIGGELRQFGDTLNETTQRLPERMAAALDGALLRAEQRTATAALAAAPAAAPRR